MQLLPLHSQLVGWRFFMHKIRRRTFSIMELLYLIGQILPNYDVLVVGRASVQEIIYIILLIKTKRPRPRTKRPCQLLKQLSKAKMGRGVVFLPSAHFY